MRVPWIIACTSRRISIWRRSGKSLQVARQSGWN